MHRLIGFHPGAGADHPEDGLEDLSHLGADRAVCPLMTRGEVKSFGTDMRDKKIDCLGMIQLDGLV